MEKEKQCRTLADVIKVMDKNCYSLVKETTETIEVKRKVLLFINKYTPTDCGVNKQYLIGNNFKVDKYNNGHYYKVYRKLS
mgnify:CR=1 FL=1